MQAEFPSRSGRTSRKKVERELGIPAKNVLITATHTHSAPGQQAAAFVQKIVESVRLAKQRLAPARIGDCTGVSYINVNRNIIDPQTRRWWEGPNYDGLSDKTVAVIKFESLDGTPIAVYYNYAMHGVAAGQLDLVAETRRARRRSTSKIASTTSRRPVVVRSCRRPESLYYQQTYDLRAIRGQGIRLARRRHQQFHASRRTGPGQERSHCHQADEPAEADDPFDGAVPR